MIAKETYYDRNLGQFNYDINKKKYKYPDWNEQWDWAKQFFDHARSQIPFMLDVPSVYWDINDQIVFLAWGDIPGNEMLAHLFVSIDADLHIEIQDHGLVVFAHDRFDVKNFPMDMLQIFHSYPWEMKEWLRDKDDD